MKKFDTYLRHKISKEQREVSNLVKDKIEETLQTLPQTTSNEKKIPPSSTICICGRMFGVCDGIPASQCKCRICRYDGKSSIYWGYHPCCYDQELFLF